MREKANRMSAHSNADLVMFFVGAVLGLLLVLTGVAMVTNRLFCEAWAVPSGVFDPLRFFGSGDAGTFGRTPSGCAAPTVAIVVAWGVVLTGATVATVFGVRAWMTWRESDKKFIESLLRRDGFARRAEVKDAIGTKAAISMTGKVRPTLPKEKRTPEAGNLRLGVSRGVTCWIGLEESVLLIGPPRSGKGVTVIVGAILDAPGPVITTSSRADNYAMTAPARAKKGPVTLFDPQGLTGKPTTMKWSPITGCEHAQTANQRANSLVSAAGLTSDGSNSEWRAPAVMIMQCLLHAAAIDGQSVDALMRWGNSPAEAKEAVTILKRAPGQSQAWGLALESEIDSDPKMRANKWFGVSNAVAGLSVQSVRDALSPESASETFDIDTFIEQCGTLYIIGTKTGGSSAGPFLVAMMDAITERAREIAAKREGNRLDPPMSLPLDEIANIATWEGLIPLMADGGGVGISPMPVVQSLAQARNNWGEQAASALYDASTVKIQLGGASNTQDLQGFRDLSGGREVIRASKSRQSDGSSVSEQIHDDQVLDVDEIRRLPFGWALVFYRNRRPMLLSLAKYWERKDADVINTAKKLYAESLLDSQKAQEWLAALTPPPVKNAKTEQLALPAGKATDVAEEAEVDEVSDDDDVMVL